jgi:hypothetical protein
MVGAGCVADVAHHNSQPAAQRADCDDLQRCATGCGGNGAAAVAALVLVLVRA